MKCHLGESYEIIVCDPPFFNVSLSRLFRAIRVLAQERFDHPLLLSYLRRRSEAVLGTFSPFALGRTDFFPSYVTVEPSERNQVEFFGNSERKCIVCSPMGWTSKRVRHIRAPRYR